MAIVLTLHRRYDSKKMTSTPKVNATSTTVRPLLQNIMGFLILTKLVYFIIKLTKYDSNRKGFFHEASY